MSDAMEFEFELEAPPAKVWRALTVDELLKAWLLEGTDAATEAPEVIEADPPHRLSWGFRDSADEPALVTITLTPNDSGGTALRLVHRRVATLRPAANSNGPALRMAA